MYEITMNLSARGRYGSFFRVHVLTHLLRVYVFTLLSLLAAGQPGLLGEGAGGYQEGGDA